MFLSLFTDAGLHSITKDQSDLTSLKLVKLKSLTSGCLSYVESRALKIVSLKGSSNIHFEGKAFFSSTTAFGGKNKNIKLLSYSPEVVCFVELFTTQSRLLTTLKKKPFENIVGKGENAGYIPKKNLFLSYIYFVVC